MKIDAIALVDVVVDEVDVDSDAHMPETVRSGACGVWDRGSIVWFF